MLCCLRHVPRASKRYFASAIQFPASNNNSTVSDSVKSPEESSSLSTDASPNPSTSIALSNHPRAQAYNQEHVRQADLPTPPQTTHPKPRPAYSSLNPPFHTHAFYSVLEKSFPEPVARTLMRSTRAMLMDKVGKARREGLGKKDMENVSWSNVMKCYLCRSRYYLASISIQSSVNRATKWHFDAREESNGCYAHVDGSLTARVGQFICEGEGGGR